MNQNIYLDYSATTPLDPDAMESMLPYFTKDYGNPSSIHQHGQKAEKGVENARNSIASILGCEPEEIIFTSGGTEANNLAIRGTSMARKVNKKANRILTTPVEHEAILKTVKQLQTYYGFEVNLIPVDSTGAVILDQFEKMLGPDVAIVSTIFGNNEIGTINPIEEIGEICDKHNIPFHTDAVQALGYIDRMTTRNITLMSAGAHKFYGPKGVGFLYKKKSHILLPTNTGGSQENNLRAGTHNVPYIAGMATALQKARSNYDEYSSHYRLLRDQIVARVKAEIPDAKITGSADFRLCNHISYVIEGIDGNELVMALDVSGYSCSSGSACKTGNPEPSKVLLAIGLDPVTAKGSIRISVGRETTEENVIGFIKALSSAVSRIRI